MEPTSVNSKLQVPYVLHVFIIEAKNVRSARGCEVDCGLSLGQVGPGEVQGRHWLNEPAEGSAATAGACLLEIRWIPPARVTIVVRPGDEFIRIRLLAPVQRRHVRLAHATDEAEADDLLHYMDEEAIVKVSDVVHSLRKGARRAAGRPGDASGPASAEQWLAVGGKNEGQVRVRWAVDSGALNGGMLLDESALDQIEEEPEALQEKKIGTRLRVFFMEERLSDLNDIGAGGGSALHLALRKGDEELVHKILLRRDFTVINALDYHDQSVLHYAADVGSADFCAKILARADFLASGQQDIFGQTALHIAIRQENRAAALSILRSGVFVAADAPDVQGTTALHLCALTGDAIVTAALLKRADCTPEREDQFGNTAESLAAGKDHLDVLTLLEPRMAKVRAPKIRRRGQM